MRRKKLVLMMAALTYMALCSMVSVAQLKPTSAPKPAAAKTFNQKAEMDKFWNGPDSAVVGKVSGVNVTKGELIKALWDRTAPNMLADLLDLKMLEQAAKKQKLKVGNADINKEIKEVLKQTQLPSKEALMEKFKVTYGFFYGKLKFQAILKKLAVAKTKVDPAEYAQYMKASHILIRFPQDIADPIQKDAAAKTKIDEIAVRLKAGEDFAKVANEASEDPISKENGGSLGWFSKGGGMVAEFEQAAFALKAGQISEPTKTTYGYHIIKAEAIGKDAAGAEQAELKQMIADTKAPMQMQMIVNDLKIESAKSRVDNISPPVDPNAMPTMGGPGGPGRPGGPRPTIRPIPPPTPTPSDRPATPPTPPTPPAE